MIAPVAAFAQNAVTGNVVDENGAPVPGAQVNIAETGQRVITDRQGRFFIPSLPEGTVTLNIFYRGLAEASETITVTPGSSTNVTITLASAQEIVVLGGITDPTARALNRQKNADATSNVISADAIGRLPDINIAEALQRVPGFGVERDQGEGNFISIRGAPSEFTAVSVDGVQLRSSSPDTRAIDLGTFNSALVASIEVSKTLLPNQDADSIAGAINLTTRSAFDRPRLTVNLEGGASYNQFGGTSDYRIGGTVSDVFGPLGITLSGTLSQTDRQLDNVEHDWNFITLPNGQEILAVPSQSYKDYDTRRERITLAGAIELRPDNISRYFLRANWNRRTDDEFRNNLVMAYDRPGAGFTSQLQNWDRSQIEFDYRHRIVRDQSIVVSAGGQHDWSSLSLDYSAAYTESKQDFPIRSQLRYRSSLRPAVTLDFRNNVNTPDVSLFSTNQHLVLSSFAFRENTFRTQDTDQSEWAFTANLRVPMQMFGAPSTFQAGAKVRLAEITSDNEQWRDRRPVGAPPFTYAQAGNPATPSRNFDYLLGSKFRNELIADYFRDIAPTSVVDATRRVSNSVTSDYEAKEDIYAGYAMTRIEFPKTNVIVGLRVEHTNFSGSAPVFNANTETFVIGEVDRKYTDFFPNLTVRHEFSPDLIGRFAATRAVSRPNFRDVVPRVTESGDPSDPLIQIARGNPDLRQTLSNNLDAGIEYYFRPLGLIGFNVFYKDLKDYEFSFVENTVFEGRPAQVTQSQNARSGRIMGFEVNVQAQFTFLPGLLSGFGVFANAAYADAFINLPPSAQNQPGLEPRPERSRLPNQSDWTYNASLFYEKGGFNARLAYTARTDYVDEFNQRAPLDTFWVGRGQLDATASLDIGKNVNVFLEAKNITNTAGIRYAGTRDRVIEFERFGAFYFVGARVNF
ncbi:MAG: TonB-dependent receptor [Erythrobacter sp.]